MELSRRQFIWFVIIPSIAIIIFTFIGYYLDDKINPAYFYSPSEYEFHYDNLGQFGDFIGGFLGTILTLIATIYVYQTYNSQKIELVSQREELKDQKEFIRSQQFETTFFNLLNTHRQLKNDLKIPKKIHGVHILSEEIIGIEVLEKVTKRLSDKYDQLNSPLNSAPFVGKPGIEREIKNYTTIPNKNISERLNFVYDIVFHEYQNQISHYCRNIYHLLKFIRRNEEENIKEYPENRDQIKIKFKEYANIFQSQLNVVEQVIIFYDFIYFNSETKGIYSTMNLVNHFKFLENVGEENLLRIDHRELYNFPITHKQ